MDSSKAKPREMHLAQRLKQPLLLSYCPETYSWDSHFCISRNLFPSEAETKLISKICHDLSKSSLASRIFERHIGFFMIRKRWFLCILVFSTFSPIHSQTRRFRTRLWQLRSVGGALTYPQQVTLLASHRLTQLQGWSAGS